MGHFLKIHAEAESNDRSLEKEFREVFAFEMERVSESEAVNEAAEERQGRGDQAAGREDEPDEEEVLAHPKSVRWERGRRPSSNSN